ncbi:MULTISPECIES: hypothetical protein [Asticcacaulis]|uniref:hypothetical protein n=1 Tax=Asticcacaulis TaxID=76890 RepID=UPI001AE6057F|nr:MULTISPECIES: hypothetical protein [Asticcacaulis]MBP2158439.1 hypothetical protein [Asticcacaulis solisilvae]MDR6799484.1 hypothetical protein [Asticcacaulis sp. BE141]
MDSEQLARRAEKHVALRKGLMIVNALAYIGWIGSQGLAQSDAFGVPPSTWEIVRHLAMPVWAVSLLLILAQYAMLKRNRAVAVLVDDERSKEKTALAFQGGYWVLLVAVASVYAATFFEPDLDMRTFMPLLLAAGVAAPAFTVTFFGKD